MWKQIYIKQVSAFSFRKSKAFESSSGPLATWLRQGELMSAQIDCSAWNADEFSRVLHTLRPLTQEKNLSVIAERLKTACASTGVAVVILPSPAGCRASGATRFLSPSKAVLMLSLRHATEDHFWFTFFHEAAHLLFHCTADIGFVDEEILEEGVQETEANEFAESVLIPSDRHSEMLNLSSERRDIIKFARSIGVSPGIVAGQLQHHGKIRMSHFNSLKRKLSFDDQSES
ncbi:MAG: ImmA/IrrE family metallo-endopeptidase [Proteobacteria bacterium]|nr:MAG: ImmA/IrrE family metallo-endopeptidase [Pseudomonadota bacterium]